MAVSGPRSLEHYEAVAQEKGDIVVVVAGVDGSATSLAVVERAIEEAQWRDTGLHVVYVAQIPTVYTEVPIDLRGLVEAQRNAAWERIDPILSDASVEIHRVDLDGYPADQLVDYATELEAALLVVGTRARGELASLVLGSTSHRAIHLARCDVLVVKGLATASE